MNLNTVEVRCIFAKILKISMKKQLFLLAFLSVILSGCSKFVDNLTNSEHPDDLTGGTDSIPIKISTLLWTKVSDGNYETGDKVGIYTVNWSDGTSGSLEQSGNHLDNMAFSFDGTEWMSEKEAYWKDDTTPADFYCYYPYMSGLQDIHSVAFSVKEDQSSREDYYASEFLYGLTRGAKPSNQAVSITTKHTMSNLLIYLKPGKGYTEETLAAEKIDITITGVKTSATIDLATGVATPAGEPGNMVPHKENGYWRALVVPQEIIEGRLLKVKVGNNTYELNQTVTFLSNHQHKCTLTVNRIGEGVNIGIGGWETDDTDYGGVLE